MEVLDRDPVLSEAPPAAQPLTLWGDGEHDDTAALQAWFDGFPVRLTDNYVQFRAEGHWILTGGAFLTTDYIYIDLDGSITLRHCTFKSTPYRDAFFVAR